VQNGERRRKRIAGREEEANGEKGYDVGVGRR
jgi:hypothetical protein